MEKINLEFSHKEIQEKFKEIGEEIQREINRLRADPCSFLPIIKNLNLLKHESFIYFKSCEYDQYFEISNKKYNKEEYLIENLKEIIVKDLKKQRPVQTLSYSENISKSSSLKNNFHHLNSINLNNKLDKHLNWENKSREIEIKNMLNSTDIVTYILINYYEFIFDQEMNYMGYYMNFENPNISQYNDEQNEVQLNIILVSKLRGLNESHFRRNHSINILSNENSQLNNEITNKPEDLLTEIKEVRLNDHGEAYITRKKTYKTNDINSVNIIEQERFYKLIK